MTENVNGNDVDCENITMHTRRVKIARTSGVDEKFSTGAGFHQQMMSTAEV